MSVSVCACDFNRTERKEACVYVLILSHINLQLHNGIYLQSRILNRNKHHIEVNNIYIYHDNTIILKCIHHNINVINYKNSCFFHSNVRWTLCFNIN